MKNAGLVTGGLTLMSASPLKLNQKKEKLGVCLVGLGKYSETRLAPALQLTKHCYLAGLVTGSPEKIPAWQKKYNVPDSNIYDYSNMHMIADNDAIDVVYIVLPTGLHSLYARIAANAGKHVWCEKPMAMNVRECQEIIDCCDKNKVKLSIGYRMQHEPNTQQLIEWSKEGKYGTIKNVEAGIGYNMIPDPAHWRLSAMMGGGYLYELGIYTINAIRYATQDEPISVVAAKHTTKRPEIFREVSEVTEYSLQFRSGLIAKGKSTAMENIHGLNVEASKGWVKIDPFSTYDGISGKTSDGHIIKDQIPNQQANQMDNDALAIMNDQHVLVPGIEGMRDVRILEAINQAAQSNQSVSLL